LMKDEVGIISLFFSSALLLRVTANPKACMKL